MLKTSKIKNNENNDNNKTPNTYPMRGNIPGQLHGSLLEVGNNSYYKVNLGEDVWFQVV